MKEEEESQLPEKHKRREALGIRGLHDHLQELLKSKFTSHANDWLACQSAAKSLNVLIKLEMALLAFKNLLLLHFWTWAESRSTDYL